MKIFISYARSDVSFIQELATELENHKIPTWVDVNSIPGGTEWEKAIAQGIKQSDVVIVCLTGDAINSKWVEKEVFLASSLGKRIIPIMIKPCFDKLISNQNLERLLDLQIIIFEGRYEAALNKLINSILEREEISAVDNIYQKSDSADFRSAIESIIFDAKSIVLVGIGLNIMGQEPFAIQLMRKAAEGECQLEIYLANPYDPAVQTRLIEEEIGEIRPPVGKEGLVRRLKTFLAIWERLGSPKGVHINLINHYPTFAYMIIDEKYFFYPYGYGTIGNFSPVLEFSANNPRAKGFLEFINRQHSLLRESAYDVRMVYHLIQDQQTFEVDELEAFAVYFVPPANSPLYKFGSKVLGYDIRQQVQQDSQWEQYIGNAKDFGFHLTICDAVYFPHKAAVRSIEAEIEFLLQDFTRFNISNLSLTDAFPDEKSFALLVNDESGNLELLHHEMVHRVCRRAIGSNYTFGHTQPDRDNNISRNELMIRRFHVPYIFNSYRPHFTLLNQVPSDQKSRIYDELRELYQGTVKEGGIRVDHVAFMHKPIPNAPWSIRKEIHLR